MAFGHRCFVCLETLGRRGDQRCDSKGFSELWRFSEQRSAHRLAKASLAAGRCEAREGKDDVGIWERNGEVRLIAMLGATKGLIHHTDIHDDCSMV